MRQTQADAESDRTQRKPSAIGFLKATLAGGLLFLLPLILVAMLVEHALQPAKAVAQPISKFLHIDAVIGLAGETPLAGSMLSAKPWPS